jgi:hypothetical protein
LLSSTKIEKSPHSYPRSWFRRRRYRDDGQGRDRLKIPQCRQTCVCANRILAQDGVHDAFTKRLAETAGAMKVADGFEPGAVIGPLIDMKAVEKVEAHIADALRKGAEEVAAGKRAAHQYEAGAVPSSSRQSSPM